MISHLISFLQSASAVVFTMGLVILLHEFGHFILCKKLGVRVEKFAFGFGPELFGVTYGETRFSLCAFPLGGFVKPAGESLEEYGGKPDEYFAQNWKRRLAIVYAGPVMNYLLAFSLFTGLVYFKGVPELDKGPVIGNMMKDYPAEKSGLKVDDRVVDIDGKAIKSWEELAGTIYKHPNEEVELTFERGGKKEKMRITPAKDDASGQGRIGIMPRQLYTKVDLPTAVVDGAKQCWALTEFTVAQILSKIMKHERPDLAGPVGIVQMVSKAAHSGWEDLLFLTGMLSVAIGFFNFLPVPLLDGGHGAMYLWEGFSGKKLTPEVVSKANGVGIVFLLSLLVFATYNDFSRILSDRAARHKPAVAAPSPSSEIDGTAPSSKQGRAPK